MIFNSGYIINGVGEVSEKASLLSNLSVVGAIVISVKFSRDLVERCDLISSP
jgi:hypothetical protein